MGFLDFLFGKKDPTSHWMAKPGLELKFDFNENALCGVKIGERFERLSKLGPSEDPTTARQGIFRYFSKGLEMGASGENVGYYVLVWDLTEFRDYRQFSGKLLYKDDEFTLDAATGEEDIVGRFGDPYWRDEDEFEIILFYEKKNVEWQFVLNTEKKLKTLIALTPPLLADEMQRNAYKVDKQWPAQ